ncbi:DUF2147 domain-containing protein [Paracoccus beibuensis]|uniref:DUF2147 domain-containing protein n=1 Tax=Paracoccus beibuensis TaxID=547602 RepID=UPI002240C974|nr:DUF2147 domain-containing protein [Paracoccus beibuensis]
MRCAILLPVLVLTALPAWGADPLAGVWRTQPGRDGGYGHVRIAPCGSTLCGTLEQSFDATGRAVMRAGTGALILSGIAATADGRYGQGRILNPETQKDYAARLTLKGDRLEVAGCVMTICRVAGLWQRVK